MFGYLRKSDRKDKRFVLTIFLNDDEYQSIHFGSKHGSTYIDHGDKNKRFNYINRHKALGTEDWSRLTPAALSKFLLWGRHTDLQDNVVDLEKMFDLKIILDI